MERRVTLETQHSFSKIDARSAMLRELMDRQRYFLRTSAYGNLDRKRLWSLNLFSLVNPYNYQRAIVLLRCEQRGNYPVFVTAKGTCRFWTLK